MPNGMVDSRIVQMQFDNQQFERGIRTSSASLEEFKRHLDFSNYGSSIDVIADKIKNIDFDVVADNLQKITEKVAGLGDVFDLVFRQIRNAIHSAVYSAERFFDTMTSQQIDVGMNKFSQMTKNVQTIMAATGASEATVYKALGRLNEFTDQTSYNFTDMAENIGKFTSVGIDLESAEKQMEGIANWAARSGGGISEASRAMYNLSQAMGVGALTKIDWKSIENASMATKEFKEKLIEAGVASGTLEKTVNADGTVIYKTAKKLGTQIEVNYKNLADTLSKKWADTATMQKAFLSYYFDDLYYRRDTLLDNAITDNVISKEDWQGLKDAEVATDDYKQTVMDAAVEVGNLTKETQKDGTVIYKTAKQFGDEMAVTYETFEESLGKGWFNKDVKEKADAMGSLGKSSYEAAQKCMTFNDVIGAWQDQLSTGWMQSFQHIIGNLSEAMDVFSNICNKVGDALGELSGYRNDLLKHWGDNGGRENLWSLIIGQVTEDGEAVAYENAYGFLDVLDDIRKMLSEAFHKFIGVFLGKDVEILAEQDQEWEFAAISVGINNLIDTIRNFITATHEFFEATAQGSDKSRWEQVQDVVIAMYSVFMLAYSVIRDISTFIGILFDQSHFGPLIDSFITVFSELGITVTDLSKSSVEGRPFLVFLLTLLEVASPLVKVIVLLGQTLADIIVTILQSARSGDSVNSFWSAFIGLVSTLASVVTAVATPILGFITALASAFGDLFKNGINETTLASTGEKIKQAFKTMLDSLFFFIPNFSSRTKAFFLRVKDGISKGFETGDFTSLINQFKGLGSRILDSIPDSFKEKVSSVLTKIKNLFSSLWTKIKMIVKSIFGGGKSESITEEVATAAGEAVSSSNDGGFVENVKKSVDNFEENLTDSLEKNGTSIFDRVKAIFTKIWNKVKGLFKSIFGGGEVKEEAKEAADKVADDSTEALNEDGIFKKVFDKVKSIFDKIIAKLQVFLGNTKGTVGSFGTSIKTTILDPLFKFLKNLNLSTILLAVIGFLGVKGVIKVIGNIVKIIKQVTEAINNVTKVMKGGVKGLLQGSDDDDDDEKSSLGDRLLKIAEAMAIMTLAITVLANLDAKAAWNATYILVAVAAVLTIMDVILAKVNEDTEYEQAISSFIGIMGIALSIFMLMKAIEPLAKLNSGQWESAIAITWNIVAALLVTCLAIKKLKFEKDDGLGALAVAGAMYVMIVALMKVKDLNPQQLLTMFGTLAAILTELGVFIVLMNKFAKGGLAGSGMKELAFVALSIGILIFSLLPLAILPWKALFKMGAGLLAVLTIIGLFTVGVNKFGGNLSDTGMAQLLAVAGSIVLIMMALLPLAIIPWPGLAKMGVGLVVVLAALMGFIIGVNKLASGGMSDTAMAQLLAVAGSIVLIILALLPLAIIPWPGLAKMGAGLIVVLAALMGFIIGINKLASGGLKETAMTQLIAVAGAVVLLMFALIPLAIMDWGQFARVIIGVIVILGMFSAVLMAAKKLNKSSALSAVIMMIALSGMMYMFAMSLALIPTDMDWKAIAAFSVGLAAIIAAMAFAISKASESKVSIKSAIIVIAAIAVGIAAILAVLSVMLPVLMGSVGSALVTMSSRLELASKMLNGFVNTLSSLNGAAIDDSGNKVDKIFAIISKFEKSSTYLKPIDDFETCMLKLGTALNTFQTSVGNITGSSGTNATALLDRLLAYVNKVQPIANYKEFITSAIYLGAGLSVFSDQSDNISIEKANNAFALIDKLITYTGFDGVLVGATDFADRASYLAGGLSSFITNSSSITDGNPPALQFLTNMANNADNINTLSTLELSGFADTMSALGGGLAIYALGVKEAEGIEIGELPDVSGAVTILQSVIDGLKMEGTEDSDFTLPELPSETDLTNFGTQIAALAGGLVKFAQASDGLTNFSKAREVLTFLNTLRTNLTVSNLLATKSFTNSGTTVATLTQFGNDISALGGSLKSYSDNTKNFVKNQGALDALDFLYDLKDKLSGNGRVFDGDIFKIFEKAELDDTALTKFGTDISALGGSMHTYYEATKDFKFDKKEGPFGALTFFDELQTNLQGKSMKKDVLEYFFGDMEVQDLEDFGKQIGELGTALAGFAKSVNFTEGDTTKKLNFDNAISAVDALSKIALTLPVIGGITGWIHGNVETLGGLSEDINLIGTALSSFSDKLSASGDLSKVPYNADLVISALNALSIIADLAMELGKQAYGEYGIFTGYEFSEALARMVDSLAGIDGSMFGQSWIDNMVSFMKKFEDAALAVGGFKDATIFTAFSNMAKGLEKLTIAGTQTNFTDVGKSIIEGIAVGIENNKSRAVNALVQAALEAYDAGKKAIDMNSPSKLFATIGESMSSGVAVGIENNADQAADAGAQMATDTFGFTSSITSMLENLLNDDSDFNPTITPVLDLSNIRSGASEINSLLGGNHTITIDTSASSFNADQALPYLNSIAANQNKIDLTGIQNQITNLQTAINNVNTTVGNLKIYLNTNVIAGAVTDDVDRGIGRNMLYASRNN